MAGVRPNLATRPAEASEHCVPVIRLDCNAMHVRSEPHIGIVTPEEFRIEPRLCAVVARVAGVYPYPGAQPS